MTVYPIILLILFGILFAFAIDRKVQETLPVYVFTFLICLFGLALIKKPHHAFDFSLLYFAATWLFYIIKKRRIFPKLLEIKEMFTPLPLSLIAYGAVLIAMYFAYGNHIVNNWDDFHFNATFARDMFTYGGMPTGWKAATGYKSYKPLMQMFYNWGFQANGYYSEPLMFRYKIFLVYTACLPLLSLADKAKGSLKKAVIVVFSLVIPYAFMFELVDSLSMDGMMGLLCAYSLVAIVFTEERDLFCYGRIAVGLITLTLVKSSAIMFTAICFAVFFFKELFAVLDMKKENSDAAVLKQCIKVKTFTFLGIGVLTGLPWLAWKIFCEKNGNVTFLNDILDDHLNNNTGLPWFGKDTIINGFKGLFTTSMNLGTLGLSLMAVVLMVLVIAVYIIRIQKPGRDVHWFYFILIGGIVPYYAVLMYTYIYVFFEYEAIALASYDRYLGTYALAILYFAFFHLCTAEKITDNMPKWLAPAVTAIIVVTLNFPVLYRGLIPSVYESSRSDWFASRTEAEMEMAAVMPENADAELTIIVSDENQTIYGRGLDLAALPLVAEEVVIRTLDRSLEEEIADRLLSEHIAYVYFSHRLSGDDIAECDRFITDGSAEPGTMYRFNEETLLLEKAK